MKGYVSGIFKVILGTIVTIVLASILTELYNMQTAALSLNTLSKISAQQACDLFAQETYKQRSGGGAINMSTINYDSGISDSGVAHAGGTYFSKNLYPGTDAASNWTALYTKSDFKNFVSTYSNTYYSLKLLDQALSPSFTERTDAVDWGTGGIDYENNKTAAMYKKELYTPLNLGITYLDQETVEKIYQWGLIELLTNCNSANIHVDDYGEPYVYYRGFRVYARDAKIDVSYQTYNLSNASEKTAFAKITGITNPERLLKTTTDTIDNSSGVEFSTICVAKVQYSVPVSYIGISPIKKVSEYTWNKRVRGMEGVEPAASTDHWSDSKQDLIGGKEGQGISGVTLPASGKLTYYVVR